MIIIRTIGRILFYGAIIVIIYNWWGCLYNKNQLNDHPWITIFSLGTNLVDAFTFFPPYTRTELTVIIAGAAGFFMRKAGLPVDTKSGNNS
jgi:hypothetical protein